MENDRLKTINKDLLEACEQARDMLLCHYPIPVFELSEDRIKDILGYLERGIAKARD